MKSTFSRAFFPASLVLLSALLLVGMSLQILVRNFLADQAMEGLENDARTISQLATAYYEGGIFTDDGFLINLSVASQVSGANAVISGADGKLLLCSDAPLGCIHQGWSISQDYFRRVLSEGCVKSTGLVEGLYDDARYVVSVPITASDGTFAGVVTVSTPIEATAGILRRISDLYLMVSIMVVLVAV